MKKKLLAALTLTLCLLMLCTACGKDKQPSSDDITPPDGTQDITPDNTQNVTPPDSTADDNKTPDDPTPPAQDDPTPPAQDDPTPSVQDDPTPPAQDEPTNPVDTQNEEIAKILQAYYDFLKNDGKGFYTYTQQEMTFVETTPFLTTTLYKFAFADFGADNIPELVLQSSQDFLVMFWDNNRLCFDILATRELAGFAYDGFFWDETGGRMDYSFISFSAERGRKYLTIGYTTYDYITETYSYDICRDLVNGEWIDRENTTVDKDAFNACIAQYERDTVIKWHRLAWINNYDDLVYYAGR